MLDSFATTSGIAVMTATLAAAFVVTYVQTRTDKKSWMPRWVCLSQALKCQVLRRLSFTPQRTPRFKSPGALQALDTVAVLEKRKEFVGYNTTLLYSEPLHIVAGKGCRLYAADGTEYLDCVNNVAHVGHGHPKVVTSTPFLSYPTILRYHQTHSRCTAAC